MSSNTILPKNISASYQPSPETVRFLANHPDEFWDCTLAETPCRYLDLHEFFGNTSHQFHSDYKRLGGLNNNLPAMTALNYMYNNAWSTHPQNGDSSTNLWYLPRNISFIHVHKAGGTTVKTLMAQAKNTLLSDKNNKYRNDRGGPVQASIETYKYSFGGGSIAQKERNQQRRQDHIQAMVAFQQQAQINDKQASIVFTTVRDPIERFVSAVQQVMHYNEDFRSSCLKWTRRATLTCAIQYTKETDYLRDVHILPMATHFRLWNEFTGFTLAVIHLRDIQLLAQYLTGRRPPTDNNDDNNHNPRGNLVPHGRDRSQVDYATSKILAHMSVQDCTTDMIAELCELYAIDVLLMQTLGFDTPYCQ